MAADGGGRAPRLLERLADAIDAEAEALATLETRDMGKPITESRHFDLPRVSLNLRFFAELQASAVAEAFPATASTRSRGMARWA